MEGEHCLKAIYVKIPAIYKKLKAAEEEGCPLYLSAPLGYGKTAALQYYFRKKAVLWISGVSGKLSQQPEIDAIRQQVIVIDDITWILDEESKRYIRQLLNNREKQVIMSGRARMPEWLKSSCIHQRFILADRKDLELNENQTEKLLKEYQVASSEELAPLICADTKGHALCIIMIAYQMQNQKKYTEVVREAARIDVYHYYNEAIYDRWPEEMKTLLMAVSNFESFDQELAEAVTEQIQVLPLLYTAMAIGDFLIKHENGNFEMIPMLRYYLLWKQSLNGNRNGQMKVYEMAARYFETIDEIQKALFYFDKVGDEESIARLLTRNATMHPGSGHYFDTRQYYFKLSQKWIENSPILMSGMSMLYSLLMQQNESEIWYEKLKKYEKDPKTEHENKKEAKRRLLYLDIALPHRGTISMVDILKNVAVLITDRKMTVPEVSLTSNLPSIMNGGKDFCDWSKSDRELAKVLKRPIELILGKWGAGIVNISLAESFFEKGEQDYYEIMTLLNSGYAKADSSGKLEMCYAATGILCRIHICRNQLKVAKNQLSEFKNKVISKDAVRLLPNIEAMETWFHLLEGNSKEVESWLKNAAPNEMQEFYILNRYQYQMKVRSYLSLEMYEEAANLIERLSVYFKEYKRTYMDMENEILKAILQYRMKLGDWKETLRQVIKQIEDYHFVFLLAKEGAAIQPLLLELDLLFVEESFEQELREQTYKMAYYYPNYLKVQEELREELTDAESQILRFYCQGMDAKKICELCRFTYNTLKFHNRNLYRKLGVNNRLEAERKAKELGL